MTIRIRRWLMTRSRGYWLAVVNNALHRDSTMASYGVNSLADDY